MGGFGARAPGGGGFGARAQQPSAEDEEMKRAIEASMQEEKSRRNTQLSEEDEMRRAIEDSERE